MVREILIALLFVSVSVAQDSIVVQTDEFCLPNSEFNIGGITYISTKSDVIALKGEPNKIIKNDDFDLEKLKYDDMIIDIAGGRVLYVSTSSPKFRTPDGLHCGMSKDEAMKIIGYENYDKNVKEYQFVNCVTEIYMVIIFNDENVVTSIGMGNDLP
jgi:hypothetical protein